MSPRSSTRRRSAPRRKLVWARQNGSALVTTAVAPALTAPIRLDVLDQFVAAYGAALIGCTIVRIRGIMSLGATAPTAAQSITAAFYIGDANDVVRGPNANDNFYDTNAAGKDYFGVEPFIAPTAAAQARIAGSEPTSRMIDIRSMRKLEEVSQRLICDFSGAGTVVSSASLDFDFSVLIMLP